MGPPNCGPVSAPVGAPNFVRSAAEAMHPTGRSAPEPNANQGRIFGMQRAVAAAVQHMHTAPARGRRTRRRTSEDHCRCEGEGYVSRFHRPQARIRRTTCSDAKRHDNDSGQHGKKRQDHQQWGDQLLGGILIG